MRLSLFIAASAGLLAAAPALAQDNAAALTLKADFGVVDLDKDGFATLEELVAIFPAAFGARTAAQHLVASKDEDGDGRLTVAELESPVPVPKITIAPDIAIMAAFTAVDSDADGRVTVAELDSYAREPVPGINAMYAQKADKNADGVLSKAEWEAERPTMRVGVNTR